MIDPGQGQTARIFCKICACPVLKGSGYITCTRGFPTLAHLRAGVKTGNYTLIVRSQYAFYNTLKTVIDRLFTRTVVQRRIQAPPSTKQPSKDFTTRTASVTSVITTSLKSLTNDPRSSVKSPTDPKAQLPNPTNGVNISDRVTGGHTSAIANVPSQVQTILTVTNLPTDTKLPVNLVTEKLTIDVSPMTTYSPTNSSHSVAAIYNPITRRAHNLRVGFGVATILSCLILLMIGLGKVAFTRYKRRGMERFGRRPIYLGGGHEMHDL